MWSVKITGVDVAGMGGMGPTGQLFGALDAVSLRIKGSC